MASLSTWIRRLRGTYRSGAFEAQMDQELRFHLDRDIEERVRGGMTRDAARAAALHAFGGVEAVKDECRDSWGLHMIEAFWQDIRFGTRQLLKTPAFSGIAVLTLALVAGSSLAEAAQLANLAAGLVVRRLGAATVDPAELLAAIDAPGQSR